MGPLEDEAFAYEPFLDLPAEPTAFVAFPDTILNFPAEPTAF
jgi:hypothetical protein